MLRAVTSRGTRPTSDRAWAIATAGCPLLQLCGEWSGALGGSRSGCVACRKEILSPEPPPRHVHDSQNETLTVHVHDTQIERLTVEQIKDLKQVFKNWDVNQHGTLDKEEVRKVVTRVPSHV